MDEWKALTSPDDAYEAAASSAISPATVAEAMDDPTIFAPMTRAFGVKGWFMLHQAMDNPNVPIRERMTYVDMCMKYGQVPTQNLAAVDPTAGVPMIQIVFPHHPDRNVTMMSAQPVIDVTPADE